jgi:hypothetical protein
LACSSIFLLNIKKFLEKRKKYIRLNIFMEDIEQELEQKSIEREPKTPESRSVEIQEVVEPEPEPEPQGVPSAVVEPVVEPPKKTKRARSQKQIEAFEKARLKRAEGIAARKKLKEEAKLQKKEEKKQPKPEVSSAKHEPKDTPRPSVHDVSVPKPVVNTPASVSNPREQVIQNHYYYYGVPPPQHDQYTKGKKKKKSKRPPTPTSSESESSEEEYEQLPPPKQEQQYFETPKPSYKFSYA